jgi:3-phosphoshikimate 1-carboxyvinyltransferase (EC 2.5.1.19)
MIIKKVEKIEKELRVPSDKSISHRSVMFGALASGTSYVKNWLVAEDTLATLDIFRKLGIDIRRENNTLEIKGGKEYFKEPEDILDAKNSGTTARITSGILAGFNFFSVLTGDESLKKRPMKRVTKPLSLMGATIIGREDASLLPIAIKGGNLIGGSFENKEASAQVKSCILLAGFLAKENTITEVIEPYISRDHTERMLSSMGADINIISNGKHIIKIKSGGVLNPINIDVPADPSSAAFIAALAILTKDSHVLLKDVLVNPTRDGFFRKAKEMGANINYTNLRHQNGEDIADIEVRYSPNLKAISIDEKDVPSLIDEIPILSVLMCFAEGISLVKGAKELRKKESDRIRAIYVNLRHAGAIIEEFEDGFSIKGPCKLKLKEIKSFKDHRIAMSMSILGMVLGTEPELDDPECVSISYPNFFQDIYS